MDFYKRMGIVCRSIPEGRVFSYGQIAMLCGKPKNARQVGYGLKMGLAGQVPAHRVVNSKGELSGAQNFLAWDMQKTLLENEGVTVTKSDKGWTVDMDKHGWKVTKKEAERLFEIFKKESI